MTADICETVDKLTKVIETQAEAINELYQLLMEHITAEEAESLPAAKKTKEAEKIWKETWT